MILGRGPATSDADIVAEYRNFLMAPETSNITNPVVLQRVSDAPDAMIRKLGKPIRSWSSPEVLAFLDKHQKSARYYHSAFVVFLILRGYFRPTIECVERVRMELTRMYRSALRPFRKQIKDTLQRNGYISKSQYGTVLTLLISFLAVAGKPLTDITRADFEAFSAAYQTRYRSRLGNKKRGDPRIASLDHVLVVWQHIVPAKRVFKHELHFAQLKTRSTRNAILRYMRWCDSAYRPSTIDSCRAGIFAFFLWLQEKHPHIRRLDGVSRAIAIEYAAELKNRVISKQYAPHYATDQYRRIRLFYDFVINEHLSTAPPRCPFQLRDIAHTPDPIMRYIDDADLQKILAYCANHASPLERVIVTVLLNTGIRASELAAIKASDIVQIQGRWKLHIHEGKGLKDRIIPLTTSCLEAIRAWQQSGWNRDSDHLFSRYGIPWRNGLSVQGVVRQLGLKIGLIGLGCHRFRHTFAVALLNFGMRESALQKLMGHATLGMTLEYARILDKTVESGFAAAVDRMQQSVQSQIPSFWLAEEFSLFAEGDTVSWIRLPHGYCRRNPQLHCESDVKCLVCDRFAATVADLPRLREMRERFVQLGMTVKAKVVEAQINRLESPQVDGVPETLPISHLTPGVF